MSKHSKGKTGTTTIETTPAGRRRQATRREREEAEWAAKSGPVTITHIDGPALDGDQPDDGQIHD